MSNLKLRLKSSGPMSFGYPVKLEGKSSVDLPLDPRVGYDEAASSYLAWRWNLVWNQVEVPIVCEYLKKLGPGAVLDAGCGLGRYRDLIRSFGHRYVGVDLSRCMLIENRRLRLTSSSFEEDLLEADLQHLPLATGTFEAIVCLRVLTHIAPSQLESVFREFARVIRPGGRAIVTDIDPAHNYTSTAIPVDRKKIRIKTYKHSPNSIVDASTTAGWTDQSVERLGAVNSKSKADSVLLTELGLEGGEPLFYLATMQMADNHIAESD